MTMDYNPELALAEEVAKYATDPLGFQRFAFPWGEGALANSKGPRSWQAKCSGMIRDHLSDPKTRFQPLMIAVASGHDIGKSAEMGMLANWAMSTCEGCKALLTANTQSQLRTKTWPEIEKWFNLSLTSRWFTVNKESITAKSKKWAEQWRLDRVTWNESNTEAFQGLHNLHRRIFIMFDEGSAIADKIFEVTEGALTDEGTEIIWIVFGNPTRNTGRFRECFGKFKHRWKHLQIDSREVEGTNKQVLQAMVEDYGEDSDFTRVRIKGEFPRAGSDQLIPSDAVEAAKTFRAQGFEMMPKIMACDVARYGDAKSVIGYRQGRFSSVLDKMAGNNTVEVSERLMQRIDEEKPDATVVDGDGIGGAIVDICRSRGYDIEEFRGGMPALDAAMYFNRRAECWGEMADWLKKGAEIARDPELYDELVTPRYGFSAKNQVQLERKEDMRRRGIASPDIADQLAMTFAVRLSSKIPPKKKEYVYVYPGQNNLAWMGA